MGRRIDTVACAVLFGLATAAGFKPAIVHAAPADPTVQSSDTAESKTSGSKNRASAKFSVAKSATGHSGEKAKNHAASPNSATSAKVVKSPATKFAALHGASSLSARSHVAHEAEVRPSAGTRTALTKNSLALRRSRPSAATHATLTKNTLALHRVPRRNAPIAGEERRCLGKCEKCEGASCDGNARCVGGAYGQNRNQKARQILVIQQGLAGQEGIGQKGQKAQAPRRSPNIE